MRCPVPLQSCMAERCPVLLCTTSSTIDNTIPALHCQRQHRIALEMQKAKDRNNLHVVLCQRGETTLMKMFWLSSNDELPLLIAALHALGGTTCKTLRVACADASMHCIIVARLWLF